MVLASRRAVAWGASAYVPCWCHVLCTPPEMPTAPSHTAMESHCVLVCDGACIVGTGTSQFLKPSGVAQPEAVQAGRHASAQF